MSTPPARPAEAHLTTGPVGPDRSVVVSPHHLASQAGLDILGAGGNAVDAAIAVDAVLGVVAPDTCGPGGDLFALIHQPGVAEPSTLNASGMAGSGTTAAQIRDEGLGDIPYRSHWSITVPGCVDGWCALNERYGALSLADVLTPAITLGRAGFPVSKELATSLERLAEMLDEQASAGPLYPHGTPPRAGDEIRRPALADTLESVAEGGREAFYEGPVGDGIIEATRGIITGDDLATGQAEWVTPTSLDIFGRTAWTVPPNSQGYLTLATLWIFEHLDPPSDADDPLFHHLLIEAYRSVAWERAMYVSDPSTAPLSAAELLDTERLAARAASIDNGRAGRWPSPAPAPGGTAYMTVRDGSGMGISFIQSNYAGIGSGLSAGATGVWLHNRGAGFNLIPGHPDEFTPGRRPMHTLSPTLWTDGTSLSMLLGTRGGDQQPQFLAQFAASHLHAGMDALEAQRRPRWFMEQPYPGTDSAMLVEDRFPRHVTGALAERGHIIDTAGSWEPGWGPISVIDVGASVLGGADPRISTSAALSS